MEIWYDPNTMEVKAVYSHLYTGVAWSDQGFINKVYEEIRQVPSDVLPGAIVDLSSDEAPVVVTPAPPPPPRPRTRLDDLRDKLIADTITFEETKEMLRLERGL